MTRKKISTDDTNVDVVAALDSDEEFIVNTTTTKRLSREKKTPPTATPTESVDISEDIEEIDAEPVIPFSPDSLAAMIYTDDEEPDFANEFCTIAVRRMPDAMGDNFATPCSTVSNLPRLPNVEITAERADVEDRVRREYGGGHYFFQIRTKDGLGRSWKSTLLDLPRHLRSEASGPEPEPAVVTVQPAASVNPFDGLVDVLQKQKQLRELLFGDEEKRMRDELAELRQKLESKRDAEPQSDLALAVTLLKDAKDPSVVDFIRDAVLPSEDAEPKTTIWDFAKYALDNKEQIAGLLSMVIGGLLPQPAQPPSANVLDVLRAQPPTALPTLGTEPEPPTPAGASRFRRKGKADTAAVTEDNSDGK